MRKVFHLLPDGPSRDLVAFTLRLERSYRAQAPLH